MTYDLTGRVALVTGGGRDIGRAVSLKLAACGAAVAVNYATSADAARETVEAIRAGGGQAVAVQADVTRSEEVDRLIREARAALGETIHILVNNAGGIVGRKTLHEMDEAFWNTVIALNLTSTFLVTKAALPYLADGGAVVNLASLAARNGGSAGSLAYATSKGAIITFTRGLAKELGPPRGIRVNCVSAGLIDTTFHDRFTTPEMRRATVESTPLRREGTADEVADAVAFLASDASSFITGESVEINGGLYFV